jgi:hypothetical protein
MYQSEWRTPLAEELIEQARERAVRCDRPANTLGYCGCCTVWNMVELGEDCPDCGEPPMHVERGQNESEH